MLIFTLGGGAHRVLHCLLQEDVGFTFPSLLTPANYELLCIRERDRWRSIGLEYFIESQLPYCLRQENGQWLAIPEVFGDVLCESAQLLRMLSGRVAPRDTDASGWVLETVDAVAPKRRRLLVKTAPGS